MRSSSYYPSQAPQVSVFLQALHFSPGMSDAGLAGKPALVCSEESLPYSVLGGKLDLPCAWGAAGLHKAAGNVTFAEQLTFLV